MVVTYSFKKVFSMFFSSSQKKLKPVLPNKTFSKEKFPAQSLLQDLNKIYLFT